MPSQKLRKILHIDMDAFYASVEQRDHPEYRGKPVVVGGNPYSRGVVSTCSYEARKFGIRSAMPASKALRLCPDAIFLRPRFDAYRDAANKIRRIFHQITPLVEPVSLDEAYLDVTTSPIQQGSATRIALLIKKTIYEQTGLIASAGVSYNKFLAKIASDLDKPDGLHIIAPGEGESFVATLPIGRFHGIGKATEGRMHKLGIRTGSDLKRVPLGRLVTLFGKAGHHYYQISRGEDLREVKTSRKAKSLGNETTFSKDISDISVMCEQLNKLFIEIFTKLTAKRLQAFTLTIKVKFIDFEQVTRSHTSSHPLTLSPSTELLVKELLNRALIPEKPVRLLGVTLSRLETAQAFATREVQLELFNR